MAIDVHSKQRTREKTKKTRKSRVRKKVRVIGVKSMHR